MLLKSIKNHLVALIGAAKQFTVDDFGFIIAALIFWLPIIILMVVVIEVIDRYLL